MGRVASQPNHRLELAVPFEFLAVAVESEIDTTLVIVGPFGTRCDDDTRGLDPEVSGQWPAGTYSVYVGTYYDASGPYALRISQDPIAAGPNLSLSPGFIPDPSQRTGVAGGPVDGGGYGSTADGPCRGMIPSTPSHQLTLTDDFAYLRVHVESGGDTTLVVLGPDGTRCNDDTSGLDPEIGGYWSAGVHDIYVGSYDGQRHQYTITFSEL